MACNPFGVVDTADPFRNKPMIPSNEIDSMMAEMASPPEKWSKARHKGASRAMGPSKTAVAAADKRFRIDRDWMAASKTKQKNIPEPGVAHQPVMKKHLAKFAPALKKGMVYMGGPAGSGRDKNTNSTKSLPEKTRQAVVPTGRNAELQAESAIDSDTDDDYVDESGIDDDDDSSEWEDSMEDSGKSSVDEKYFQRVKSKVNLVSRPSLITLMVAQNERQKALSDQASHSASEVMRSGPGSRVGPTMGAPNDSDDGQLMMKGMRPSNLKPIIEVPRSVAQAIPAAPNYVHAPAALSPRTTRHNMLATELTKMDLSYLLCERRQIHRTANAVLKRRHTSHDVADLKQFPDKPCMKESWNEHLNELERNGYHSQGW